jgi:hypothetical protein
MQLQLGREIWVNGRDCFMFYCDTSSGIRWTFTVDTVVLEVLEPNAIDGPAAIFGRNRLAITRLHVGGFLTGTPAGGRFSMHTRS